MKAEFQRIARRDKKDFHSDFGPEKIKSVTVSIVSPSICHEVMGPFECRVSKNSRRDKKAFLNDQCKETEENNRMGKTRGLFKKIRNIREHFMQRWAQ